MSTRTIRLSRWMEDLPDSIKERPLNTLAIPGSHDSLTNDVSATARPSPDLEKSLLKTYKLPGSRYIVSPIFRVWCKTQEYDAREQLNIGIRYFDLRVAPDKDGKIRVVHGLYSNEVEPSLKEINGFLEENSDELVIIDLQKFYGFNPELHVQLISSVKRTFAEKMCPKQRLPTVKLKSLISDDLRVIVIYREDSFADLDPLLWSGFSWPTAWPNTTDPSRMIDFAESHLKDRAKNKGFITQLILTPDGELIKCKPLSGIKVACAKAVSSLVNQWLTEKGRQFSPCVVISDFVDMNRGEFCKNVISINFATDDTIKFDK